MIRERADVASELVAPSLAELKRLAESDSVLDRAVFELWRGRDLISSVRAARLSREKADALLAELGRAQQENQRLRDALVVYANQPRGTSHDERVARAALAAAVVVPPNVGCDGHPDCKATRHLHGCFADRGDCDHPERHSGGSPERKRDDVSDDLRPSVDLVVEPWGRGTPMMDGGTGSPRGVRITHKPTGISAEWDEEKSQLRNRASALRILRDLVSEQLAAPVVGQPAREALRRIGELEAINAQITRHRDAVAVRVADLEAALREWRDLAFRDAPLSVLRRANLLLGDTPAAGSPPEGERGGQPAREARGYVGPVAREITFDAQRDPMFQDERENGWVPLARFDEVVDERDALAGRVADLEAALQAIIDVEPARAGTVASEIARNALADSSPDRS